MHVHIHTHTHTAIHMTFSFQIHIYFKCFLPHAGTGGMPLRANGSTLHGPGKKSPATVMTKSGLQEKTICLTSRRN